MSFIATWPSTMELFTLLLGLALAFNAAEASFNGEICQEEETVCTNPPSVVFDIPDEQECNDVSNTRDTVTQREWH